VTAPAAAPVVPRFLERTVDFQSIRADADEESGDGRTFEGYAAVFGSQTRIDSWEGRFEEQIAKGAFRKSIRDRMPVLQFDHGRNSRYGSIPIGAIRTLKEDEKGLHVVARMHADPFFGPLREAIGSKSINGMSFRFEVVKEDWHYKGKRITDPDEVMRLIYGRVDPDDDELVVRTLKELKVPELGPVVFPAYADTTASVRSFEMARALEADASLGQQVRASIARAMVVKVRNEDDADPPVENAEKPDSITTETAPEPDQPEVVSEEAPLVEEPPAPEGHSEVEVEPPAAGHSEPDTAPDGGRDNNPPPIPTNLDAEERRLARQRMAESIRGRHSAALPNARKYA
jgi:HK97 family phage prohead protease